MNSGDRIVKFNGVDVKVNDIKDANIRAMFGIGHYNPWHRKVVHVAGRHWPYSPEYCPADEFESEWFSDGRYLLCLGCGLDGT